MPTFDYQARSKEGNIQSGRVEAGNEAAAIDILQRHGLIITSLEAVEERPIWSRRIKFFERVGGKDLAIFSRQLSTLFEADVPLVSSLHTLANQISSTTFKEAILDIAADVEGGTAFSDALQEHTNIFSNFYIQMIKAGEASGKLDEVLKYLAEHTEREYHTLSKLKGAMAYPAFVMSAFIVVAAVMMIFVIPNLLNLLTQTGAELPFVTKVLIFVSDIIQNFWYLLLAVAGGGGFGIWYYLKTQEGRELWDRLQLKIPVLGGLFKKVYIFRFAESLGMLIRGGVPISKSLEITANVVGNTVYKNIILEARRSVNRGESVSETLSAYSEMPDIVTQMVSVGEKTGKLDSILGNISEFYQEEMNSSIDNLTALIEPILLVFMGTGVAFLVAGILLPIYSSLSAVQ